MMWVNLFKIIFSFTMKYRSLNRIYSQGLYMSSLLFKFQMVVQM